MHRNTALALCLLLAATIQFHASSAERFTPRYAQAVLTDQPVAYWRFDDAEGLPAASSIAPGVIRLEGTVAGNVALRQSGPRPEGFPEFETDNLAASFDGKGSFFRVKDPGEKSPLDFTNGDSITLEAWVDLKDIQNGQNIYVLGKGRTQNKGFAPHNQNYALRLRGVDDDARISFVFRTHEGADAKDEKDWHRWTSDVGFHEGTGWHHIAITYTFGSSESIRGYVNGAEVKGAWDMGGPSNAAPVSDDDELWIGSSMGGSLSSSFNGLIDEVAIYRAALSAEKMALRFKATPTARGPVPGPNDDGKTVGSVTASTQLPNIAAPLPQDLPKDALRVDILEGLDKKDSFEFTTSQITETYTEPAFGFSGYPNKYNEKGIVVDRSRPFALRAAAAITLPAGEHRVMLRSRAGSRLLMDGQVIATTPQPKGASGGHENVKGTESLVLPGLRAIQPGHNEKVVTIKSDGAQHVFSLEAIVGNGKVRPEVGEMTVSFSTPSTKGEVFRLLSPKVSVALSDDEWKAYAETQRVTHIAANAAKRKSISEKETAYWAMRHDLARKQLAQVPAPPAPALPKGISALNDLDKYVGAQLAAKNLTPAPLSDDWTFLRRVTIDVTGLIPNPEQIAAFIADKNPDKRSKYIDSLLQSPSWADNWVGYWQDVLAENPGLLKPQLNNSGPFRWWIHESFSDNKPIDRFATELILMEGSVERGGPAGFAMASQNDVPFAEKAHIVSKAFLAFELKCARCHDAPHHDFVQQDLFNVTAMLKKAPQEVPKTSSIPGDETRLRKLAVDVTLKPGTKVEPAWPFNKRLPNVGAVADLPAGVLRDASNTREQLAAMFTSPKNNRFAEVIANRIWKRYMGWGIVEPVDDWETAKPANPELLSYLARELATHDYDLKHLARVILNSHTYQRAASAEPSKADAKEQRNFASQMRRRMTAEQVVDSLFAAAGKDFGCEELNFDVDGRQSVNEMQNLGVPRRAWEFTSMSNERDRPALSLPIAASIIDVLSRFGWREARQAPITDREVAPNVLQPAIVANGIVGNRIAKLSDNSALTALCLKEQPVNDLITQVYQRLLCRNPNAGEVQAFSSLLAEGYASRVVPPKAHHTETKAAELQVSWSNHLSPEASKIKLELERRAREGDPATERLNPQWRERMEDMLWSLVNSPEFLFVP